LIGQVAPLLGRKSHEGREGPHRLVATVSPPPATDVSLPALVSAAAARASANVPSPKGATSKAPSGPFHNSVLELAIMSV
jgi:hypothetical protein